MSGFLGDLAWAGFKLTFGLSSLATVWARAVLKNGAPWASDTDEDKRELVSAQENHWSLERQPLPGFRHAFFKTRLGTSLHYVTNANADEITSTPKNVAIFIHGECPEWITKSFKALSKAVWLIVHRLPRFLPPLAPHSPVYRAAA